MRALIIVLLLANSFIFTGCNSKDPYQLAGLNVRYPDLSSAATLKAVRVDKNNPSLIIDTISIGELNSSNNYSLFVEFENEPPNYILFIENTAYSDAITDILIERKGSNNKVKTFEYTHNGERKSDTDLVID